MTKHSKTELNKTRLLDEGIELFNKYGFHGIGLKGILSSVNVPKGSFYYYFDSKEGFGVEVIDHYTKITHKQLVEIFSNNEVSGLAALKEFFNKIVQIHLNDGNKHGCLAGNLGAEVSDTSTRCRKAVEHSMSVMSSAFRDVIERGQKDGSIRQDISSDALADVLLNSFEGALLRMKIEKTGESLKQFQDVFLDKFLNTS